MTVRVRAGRSALERLDLAAEASDTPRMDPLVIALAQLVRDRWAAEQRERAAGRARLTVVEGRRDATTPRGG